MRAVLIVFLLLFIAPTAGIKGYQHKIQLKILQCEMRFTGKFIN